LCFHWSAATAPTVALEPPKWCIPFAGMRVQIIGVFVQKRNSGLQTYGTCRGRNTTRKHAEEYERWGMDVEEANSKNSNSSPQTREKQSDTKKTKKINHLVLPEDGNILIGPGEPVDDAVVSNGGAPSMARG